MWLAIAIIATFLLSMAFMPKTKREELRASTIEDLDFPRASFGDAIPMVWGTVKQKSPILLWYGGFEVGPISTNGVTTAYKHYLGMDLAICLGPNVRLREIWSDDQQVWIGSALNEIVTINLPNLYGGEGQGGGLVGQYSFWCGNHADHPTDPQLQDSYLLGVGIMPLPSYAGVCHIVVRGAYYGLQPTPKPYSFVVTRIPDGLNPTKAMMPNGYDINPMEIVYDVLTSDWGGVGLDPSNIDIDSFVSASNTLYAEGLGMSLMVQNAVEAKTVLAECMKVADGLLYQETSTGKIKIKLIRSGESTSGILVLDESNIVGSPKNFKKSTWESTFNQVRVSFDDRGRFYNSSIAMAQDFGNVMGKARIRSTSMDAPGVKDPTVAGRISNRHLALVCVPLYACELQANREASDLRPGSLFKLSWSRYGIENLVMRVTKIDLGTLEDGVVTINCVQDRYATALNNMSAIGIDIDDGTRTDPDPIPTQNTDFWIPPIFLINTYYANGAFNSALMDQLRTSGYYRPHVRKPLNIGETQFEGRLATRYKVWAGYSSGSVSSLLESGGSKGYFYKTQGRIVDAYDRSVALDTYIDTSQTLIIEFPDREQNFTSASQASQVPGVMTGAEGSNPLQNRLSNGIFKVGEEIMKGWEAEAIPGTKRIKYKKVWRGLYDTVPESHAANTRVYFELDSGGPDSDMIPSVLHGEKLWAQVREYIEPNVYEGPTDTQELPPMTDRQIRPIRPGGFKLNGSRAPIAVSTSGTTPPNMSVTINARARTDPFLRLPDDDIVPEKPPSGYIVTFVAGQPVQTFWELAHVFEWEMSGANVSSGRFIANALAGIFTLNWSSIPGGSGILTNVGLSTIEIKAYCAERYLAFNPSTGAYDERPVSEWLFSQSFDECSIDVEKT